MGLLGNGWDDPQSQAVMALAGGLLSGNFGQGAKDYGSVLAGAKDAEMKRQLLKMQMDKGGLELDAERQKLADDQKARSVLMNYGTPSQVQAGGAGLSQSVMSALPAEFQTPTVAARPGFTPQAQPQKSDFFTHYMGLADQYNKAGLPDRAQAAMATAEKFRPKYNTTPQQMMVNGKLTNVLLSEDGSAKTLDGFDVKPDMVVEDLGDKKVWKNKNAIKDGEVMVKGQTPDGKASNAVAWANYGLSKEAAARAVANENKPQWIEALGGFADPRTQVVKPALDMQGKPMAINKPLTETQGKATTFAARMQDADKTLQELEGKVSPNAVAQAGYRSEMPNWLPAGQAIGAGITAANQSFNPMVTPDAQRYKQAQENWVTANLRQESGAAISKDEMDKDVRKWFPQPGESDAVKAQKAQARAVAARAMVVQAGHGASQLKDIVNGPQSGGAGSSWSIQKVQ